jgi:hypothetical protein
MSALRDLTDQRFGRLVVLQRAKNVLANCAYWLCRCDCGRKNSERVQSALWEAWFTFRTVLLIDRLAVASRAEEVAL